MQTITTDYFMKINNKNLIAYFTLLLTYATTNISHAALGAINGNLSVDSTGAANYTIPIDVPPGINGMQPNLSLSYNSNGGNGLMGVGWSLNGISVIKRCKGNIANDGNNLGILLDNTDNYCLNGQRLFKIKDNSGNPAGSQEFRQEIENWSRIVAYNLQAGNYERFKVWTKDKKILEFGAIEDGGAVSGKDGQLVGAGGAILAWSLKRVTDVFGNSMKIRYTPQPPSEVAIQATGEQYPDKITYTRRSGLPAKRSVKFHYENRQYDPIIQWINNTKFTTKKRLTKISTHMNAGGAYGNVFDYVIGYTDKNLVETGGIKRSFVTSIQKCGYEGDTKNCFPVTEYNWENAGGDFLAGIWIGNVPVHYETDQSKFDDWNQLIDLNNDGYTDLVSGSKDSSTLTIQVHTEVTNGAHSDFTPKTVSVGDVISNEVTKLSDSFEFADFNGDGYIDIASVKNSTGITGNKYIKIWFADKDLNYTESAKITEDTLNPDTYEIDSSGKFMGFRFWNQIIDMNGDGRADIFTATNREGGYQIHTSNGDGKFTLWGEGVNSIGVFTQTNFGFVASNHLADFNGDGLIDILRKASAASDGYRILYSNGNGTFSARQESGYDKILNSQIDSNYNNGTYLTFENQFIDLNSDGNLDIVSAGLPQSKNLVFPYDTTNKNAIAVYYDAKFFSYINQGNGDLGDTSQSDNKKETLGIDGLDTISTTVNYCGHDAYQGNLVDVINNEIFSGKGYFDAYDKACALGNESGVPEWTHTFPNGTVQKYNCMPGGNVFVCARGASYINENGLTIYPQRKAPTILNGEDYEGISHYNQFADMNGDGILDLIRMDKDRKVTIQWGKGDGGFTTTKVDTGITAPGTGGIRSHFRVIDMDGDTKPDIVTINNGHMKYLINRFITPKHIVQIREGVNPNNANVSEKWYILKYRTLVYLERDKSNGARYTPNSSALSYPYQEPNKKMTVVRYFTETNYRPDLGDYSYLFQHNFSYFEGKTNLQRKQFSFGRITDQVRLGDSQSEAKGKKHKLIYHNYYNEFPLTGIQYYQGTYQNIDLRSSTTSLYSYTTLPIGGANNSTHGKCAAETEAGKTRYLTYMARSKKFKAFSINPDGSINQPINQRTDFKATSSNILPIDACGNPVKTENYMDGTGSLFGRTETLYDYTYDTANTAIGLVSKRLTSIKSTSSANNQDKDIEETFFSTGKLESQIIFPGKDLELTTTYGYDKYGNVNHKLVRGWDGEYDDAGNAVDGFTRDREINHVYDYYDNNKITITSTKSSDTASSGGSALVHEEIREIGAKYGGVINVFDANGQRSGTEYNQFGLPDKVIKTDGTYKNIIYKYIGYEDFECDATAACPPFTSYIVQKDAKSNTGTSIDTTETFYDGFGRELRTIFTGASGVKLKSDTTYTKDGRIAKIYKNKTTSFYDNPAVLHSSFEYEDYVNTTLNGEITDTFTGTTFIVTSPSGVKTKYILTKAGIKIYEDFQGPEQRYIEKSFSLPPAGFNKHKRYGLLRSVNYNGETGINYQYDRYGKLKEIIKSDNTFINNDEGIKIVYQYDEYSRLAFQSDPSLGEQEYRYNAFGDIKWKRDAKGQVTTWSYDRLGRQITMDNVDGPYTWEYDISPDNGIGKLFKATAPNSHQRTYYYDDYGRIQDVVSDINGQTFTKQTSYNSFGQLETIQYGDYRNSETYSVNDAYDLKLRYKYKRRALDSIEEKKGTSYETLWQADAYNNDNQLTDETYGNNVSSSRSYYDETNLLHTIQTGTASNATTYQNQEYAYYNRNNLKYRKDTLFNYQENYDYDSLDRLTSISGLGTVKTISYDYAGNIQYKDRDYTYNTNQADILGAIGGTQNATSDLADVNDDGVVNATDVGETTDGILTASTNQNRDCNQDSFIDVRDIVCIYNSLQHSGGYQFNYDANGNLKAATDETTLFNINSDRQLTYNGVDKPTNISFEGKTVDFEYDANTTRTVKTVTSGSNVTITTYIDKQYEQIVDGSDTRFRYHIFAGNRLVSVITKWKNAAKTDKHYVHTDHLGSVDVLTDHNGNRLRHYNYDVFGKPILLSNYTSVPSWYSKTVNEFANSSKYTSRGYTGHEMDYGLELINMNARLYDPWIGRFITPDSIIPDMENPHALNRYAYVYGNPLRYVDPSGHAGQTPSEVAENMWRWLFGGEATTVVDSGSYNTITTSGVPGATPTVALGQEAAVMSVQEVFQVMIESSVRNMQLNKHETAEFIGDVALYSAEVSAIAAYATRYPPLLPITGSTAFVFGVVAFAAAETEYVLKRNPTDVYQGALVDLLAESTPIRKSSEAFVMGYKVGGEIVNAFDNGNNEHAVEHP